MDPDEYKVKILHCINPHLIWVLVKNKKKDQNLRFEQIGIYGIRPLNVEIDIDDNITTTKCDDWLPAIYLAMKKIFLEAKEIYFSETFLDKSSSIFDDSLHKFGDLKIMMRNGNIVSMRQRLIDTGLAAEDPDYFTTKLNTNLNYITMANVIKSIKESFNSLNIPLQQLESTLKKQISTYETMVKLEEPSHDSNVENHYKRIALVQKKVNNLNNCKDTNEESLGRANTGKISTSLENYGVIKEPSIITGKEDLLDVHLTCRTKQDLEVFNDKSLDVYQNKEESNPKNDEKSALPSYIRKKGNKFPQRILKNDKRYIAIGPGGLSTSQYVLKEVKEEQKEEIKTEKSVTEDIKESNQGMFEKTDSEVNLNISNLKTLASKIEPEAIKKASNSTNGNTKTKDLVQDNIQNCKTTEKKQLSSTLQRRLNILQGKMVKLNTSRSTTEDSDSATKQGA